MTLAELLDVAGARKKLRSWAGAAAIKIHRASPEQSALSVTAASQSAACPRNLGSRIIHAFFDYANLSQFAHVSAISSIAGRFGSLMFNRRATQCARDSCHEIEICARPSCLASSKARELVHI
jgi:hypothetical protein